MSSVGSSGSSDHSDDLDHLENLEHGTHYSQSNLPPWTLDYPELEKDEHGNLDLEKLLEGIDDRHTEWMEGMTMETLREQRIQMLSELENVSHDTLGTWLTKLEKYRVIDELQHLQMGRYVRWVSFANPEHPRLILGGFVCGIYIEETGIEVEVLARRKFVHRFSYDDVFLFQRLTPQEEILLSLVEYLEGNEDDADDANETENEDTLTTLSSQSSKLSNLSKSSKSSKSLDAFMKTYSRVSRQSSASASASTSLGSFGSSASVSSSVPASSSVYTE